MAKAALVFCLASTAMAALSWTTQDFIQLYSGFTADAVAHKLEHYERNACVSFLGKTAGDARIMHYNYVESEPDGSDNQSSRGPGFYISAGMYAYSDLKLLWQCFRSPRSVYEEPITSNDDEMSAGNAR